MREYDFSLTYTLPQKERMLMETLILAYFPHCLVKMTESFLKNNYFELHSIGKLQIYGTGIAFKFTVPYVCIYR